MDKSQDTQSTNRVDLPDFLVIGAMKCGTTSLQHYLDSHPGIRMAPKELNFFSKEENWRKGVSWYRQYFLGVDSVQGEVCPGYSKRHLYGDIAKRMHSVVPNARIVYVVRHPVSRMISQLSHIIGEDATGRSQDQILADTEESILNTSRYAYQIEKYFEYFGSENVLIVSAENLHRDRTGTLKQIFGFIGVDEEFTSKEFDDIRHDSSVKVRRNVLGRILLRVPFLNKTETLAKSIVPRRFYPIFAKLLGSSFEKPVLTYNQKAEILRKLRPDIKRLEQLTGQSFSDWKIGPEN